MIKLSAVVPGNMGVMHAVTQNAHSLGASRVQTLEGSIREALCSHGYMLLNPRENRGAALCLWENRTKR